jgi:hypothetical protein
MQGYQEVLAAAKADQRLNDVFLYVDATPYRVKNGSTVRKFPTGFLLVDPTDDPAKLSFNALRGARVHISGGNSSRVQAFADRVWMFNPSVLCWDDGDQMEVWRDQ